MTAATSQKDLVVLTADKNMQFAVRGIVDRTRSLHIRPIDADFHIHPERHPGVLGSSHEFLRGFLQSHRHAIVVFDREGCGEESKNRKDLEATVEDSLRVSGWMNRAAAVVIEPELENWVWSDSPHVARELGWTTGLGNLRVRLQDREFSFRDDGKPSRPKEALEAVLREVRKPRSSALYQSLSQKVGLSRCTDEAFLKLRTTLQGWFQED